MMQADSTGDFSKHQWGIIRQSGISDHERVCDPSREGRAWVPLPSLSVTGGRMVRKGKGHLFSDASGCRKNSKMCSTDWQKPTDKQRSEVSMWCQPDVCLQAVGGGHGQYINEAIFWRSCYLYRMSSPSSARSWLMPWGWGGGGTKENSRANFLHFCAQVECAHHPQHGVLLVGFRLGLGGRPWMPLLGSLMGTMLHLWWWQEQVFTHFGN